MKRKIVNNAVVSFTAQILLVFMAIIFFCYFYFGIVTKEAVSPDYNVPIAQTIVSGEFLHVHSTVNPYIYFPGSSHFILAFFLLLHLPINLFGVFSWLCLFVACKKLGDTFALHKITSVIYAASFSTTMSVVRTINDQSIDKWLCMWFIVSLILLEKPRPTLKYFLLLGFSLGMLIGTKYSGPLFFLALVPFYLKSIFRQLTFFRFLGGAVVFSVTGLFWYIRNLILEGSPLYPAPLLIFKGWPNFDQQDWMLWKIPFVYPDALIPLLNAFLSEYIIWSLSGFVIVWFLISSYRRKEKIDNRFKRILNLIIASGFVCLLLPITPAYKIHLFQIVSDMRYIYIFVVLMMLAVFILAEKYKKEELLASVALINAIPPFSYVHYQPKVVILCIALFLLLYSKREKLFEKIVSI